MTKLRSESGKRLIRLVISLAMTEGLSALKSRSRINYKPQDSLVLFGKRLSLFSVDQMAVEMVKTYCS